MKGVRIEIEARTDGGNVWWGLLCWHGGGRCRELLETPDYDALNRAVYAQTRREGRGLWAYTLPYYRTIRPYVRRVRNLARIRGLKTRTIYGEISPVDTFQGILEVQR